MLTEAQIKRNLKKWGFNSYHESVVEEMQKRFEKFAGKKAKQVQRGGRVALPSEYFGVDSGRYMANAAPGSSLEVSEQYIRAPLEASFSGGKQKGGRVANPAEYYGVNSGRYSADAAPGSSLAVTDQFIREPLGTSDPSGVLVGGSRKRFEVTEKAIKEVTSDMKLSKKQRDEVKRHIEEKFTEILDKVSRKSKGEEHLSKKTFEEVSNMKMYKL